MSSALRHSTTTGLCACGGSRVDGLCVTCFPLPQVRYVICTTCRYEKPATEPCGLPCV